MMFLKCLVIFLSVIFSGNAAASVSAPECNNNEERCADGRCRPVEIGCARASMLKALLKSSLRLHENETETQNKRVLPAQENGRTACGLRLNPKYVYECINGEYYNCDAFMETGTVMKVTRLTSDNNAPPVSVEVTCTLDAIYNVSFKCMGEMEQLRKEFNDLSLGEMTAYENDFNKANQTFAVVEKLALNYNRFKSELQTKLDQMQRKMDECNIFFDLLLNQFEGEFMKFEENNRTCDMPPNPKDGWYYVTALQVNNVLSPETAIVLHYACDRGFALIGTNTSRCINGVWLDNFPYCTAGCKLEKKHGFKYHCPRADTGNDVCEDYVTVGSAVTVSRLQGTNTTATISCLNDGTFNISTDCVQELEEYQREFENPAIANMIDFETKFNEMKNNDRTYEFEKLVGEYRAFEESVNNNMLRMQQKAEECDIRLDLLLP